MLSIAGEIVSSRRIHRAYPLMSYSLLGICKQLFLGLSVSSRYRGISSSSASITIPNFYQLLGSTFNRVCLQCLPISECPHYNFQIHYNPLSTVTSMTTIWIFTPEKFKGLLQLPRSIICINSAFALCKVYVLIIIIPVHFFPAFQ